MSQLLQVATRGGSISVTDEHIPPAYFAQGLPFELDGTLAVDHVGLISHVHQGLPFSPTGRLVVSFGGVVTRIGDGGAPFTADNHLALEDAAVSFYASGIPYTSSGQISASIPVINPVPQVFQSTVGSIEPDGITVIWDRDMMITGAILSQVTVTVSGAPVNVIDVVFHPISKSIMGIIIDRDFAPGETVSWTYAIGAQKLQEIQAPNTEAAAGEYITVNDVCGITVGGADGTQFNMGPQKWSDACPMFRD